jgi:hypothetical protein
MNTPRTSKRLAGVLLLGTCLLSGCWWSSSEQTLTLAVADTPVDGAQSVVVTFTGVQLQGTTGAPVEFDYDSPVQINLLELQDDNYALLLDGVEVPAGKYRWIRLMVDMSQSNITLADGSVHPLVIPSGDQTGLKLVSGFDIASDEDAVFTLDFDLRKSITLAAGTYVFRPAMRLLDVNQTGALEGIVSNTLSIGGVPISSPACQPAAYAFAGSNVTPVDIDPTATVQPVQTADVFLDSFSGNFHYGFDYMPPGNYTVALVCAAGDDAAVADSLSFTAAKNGRVTVGYLTEVDFP